jgi:hypothetical protein
MDVPCHSPLLNSPRIARLPFAPTVPPIGSAAIDGTAGSLEQYFSSQVTGAQSLEQNHWNRITGTASLQESHWSKVVAREELDPRKPIDLSRPPRIGLKTSGNRIIQHSSIMIGHNGATPCTESTRPSDALAQQGATGGKCPFAPWRNDGFETQGTIDSFREIGDRRVESRNSQENMDSGIPFWSSSGNSVSVSGYRPCSNW